MMHTEKFIDETRNKELGMFFFYVTEDEGFKKNVRYQVLIPFMLLLEHS